MMEPQLALLPTHTRTKNKSALNTVSGQPGSGLQGAQAEESEMPGGVAGRKVGWRLAPKARASSSCAAAIH